MRHEMDDAWKALDRIDKWIEDWDREADAAMLEPEQPPVPKPRDLMAGSDGA